MCEHELSEEQLDYWHDKSATAADICRFNTDTIPRKSVPVTMNGTKLKDLRISVDRPPYSEIMLCPHCLNAYYIGNYKEDNSLIFEPDEFIKSSYIGIKSIEEYYEHITQCKPIFKEGINKVKKGSRNKTKAMVEKLSCWANTDTHFRILLTTADKLREDIKDDGFISYVYVANGLPVAFASYTLGFVDFREIEEPRYVFQLHDLFTFATFRNRGIASTLINYAICDLEIDNGVMGVYYPLTEDSARVLKKYKHIPM